MGLRRSDKELCGQINQVISRKREQIDEILKSYGVPLLPVRNEKKAEKD
jgi:hypothetical protein